MRKRNVDKHIWFDRQEAQDLQKKAKKRKHRFYG